jgi:translation initiation factor 1A
MRARQPYKPKGELFAIVKEMSGGSRVSALCEDGHSRVGRIIGKMKKRVWIRPNDLLIVVPWVVQSDKRCDVIYRYTGIEKERLKRKGLLPELMDI